MRPLLILFAGLLLVWSGLHAEPTTAHGDVVSWSEGAAHAHGHGDEQRNDGSSPDLHHHHCPPCAAIDGAQFELSHIFSPQIMVAIEKSLALGDPRAPPLDPPRA